MVTWSNTAGTIARRRGPLYSRAMRRRLPSTGLLLVLALAAAAPARADAPRFDVVDLGTLGGAESHAVAVDDDGVVVGTSQVAGGAVHAFRWGDGALTDLGTLGGGGSRPVALAGGVAAGSAETA